MTYIPDGKSPPSPPRIGDISACHLTVHVSDLQAALTFYARQLGLTVIAGTPAEKRFVLAAGSSRLSVIEDLPRIPAGATQRIELTFETPDLDALVGDMSRRGVRVTTRVLEAKRYRELGILDPEGNPIRLTEFFPPGRD